MGPAKVRVARKVVKVAAVAAIKSPRLVVAALLAMQGILVPILAAVLPEDRADALYHSYDGGGVEVSGPSLLARLHLGKSAAISANYYVDSISSASIDVVTSASPYHEQRTEKTVGLDYLHNKTTMSLGYTHSQETDYDARTASFSLSQDFFGDLSTLTLGYSRGWDTVGKTGDPAFSENTDRQDYRLGFSQILSKNLLMSLDFETISDEGFLNNPYRSVRYRDSTSGIGYSYEAELYPRTHTSNAIALHGLYYLPYRAALKGGFRYYNDSWGVNAYTADLGYTHPLKSGWIFDFKYRYYTQTKADFYSDLFPHQQAQNFLARDKELSTFNSQSFGLGISYTIHPNSLRFLDKGSINLSYNHIRFDYDNFRDLSASGAAGAEPLYSFSADVLQLYLSLWY